MPGLPALRYPTEGVVLLGKYRVERLIGEGGMGSVVKAVHIELDEPVAFKVLLPELLDNPDIVRRFLREAKSAVKLKGEHIARVIDVGQLDGFFEGRPYIMMEYLDGADLRSVLKYHGAQEPGVAVDLLLQACEAIAEAHAFGIVHRDIKPSNFFVTRPDGQSFLKVLDFGISTAPAGSNDVTSTETVIGTPAYMAPEQMRNARDADPRSDVWSLGVVLYECVEGRRPFASDAYPELCLAVGMDPPDPMQRTPEGLQPVIARCLEKSPDRRFQHVAELAWALVPFAASPIHAHAAAESCARVLARRRSSARAVAVPERGDPISGTPPPVSATVRPSAARPAAQGGTRWGIIFASFVVACGLGIGGWWWYESSQPAAPPPHDEPRILLAPPASPPPAPSPQPATPAAPAATVTPAPAPSPKPTPPKRAAPAKRKKPAPASDDPFGHR